MSEFGYLVIADSRLTAVTYLYFLFCWWESMVAVRRRANPDWKEFIYLTLTAICLAFRVACDWRERVVVVRCTKSDRIKVN